MILPKFIGSMLVYKVYHTQYSTFFILNHYLGGGGFHCLFIKTNEMIQSLTDGNRENLLCLVNCSIFLLQSIFMDSEQ